MFQSPPPCVTGLVTYQRDETGIFTVTRNKDILWVVFLECPRVVEHFLDSYSASVNS